LVFRLLRIVKPSFVVTFFRNFKDKSHSEKSEAS